MFSFIKNSPTCFHAVKNISDSLIENGFIRLSESEKWSLEPGKKYFVTRNSSSVIAFVLPARDLSKIRPFHISASHSDSPCFKIKENPEISSCTGIVLNVEKYGGMLLAPWFDRPLSVAGRIIVRTGDENTPLKEILVNIDHDLVLIPNLAIHFNREANDGRKIDVQNEIRPVLSMSENQKSGGKTDKSQDKILLSLVAENAGVKPSEIISHDLFLYTRSEPSVWGAKEEFISAPRLDDLECAFTTLEGFLSAASDGLSDGQIPVYCVFDNEEVGSSSRQGADSTFLSDTIERLAEKFDWTGEDLKISLSKSIMLSADNAHAVHPNYVSSSDPVNRPKLNGGIVIKYNAAQKYTTDALSSAFFKEVCRKTEVPFQVFTNNSNVAGGSTLGNISQTHVSVPSVDIGLAQWAMHSPYESAGIKDIDYMISAIKGFYK